MTHDTDKCPKCGDQLVWADISPDLGICPKCGFQSPVCGKYLQPALALTAAMHRIRELEARIAAMEAALKEIAAQAAGSRIVNIAREALKK